MLSTLRAAGYPCRIRALSTWQREMAKVKYGVSLLRDQVKLSATNLQAGLKSEHESRQVKRTALDMIRIVPFLGVAALPGGTVLIPLVAKIMPSFLPSTFTNVQSANKGDGNNSIEGVLEIRKKMVSALKDLLQRAKARPIEDTTIVKQLEDFVAKPTGEQLQFEYLYAVNDRAVLNLLDNDTIVMLLAYFGLPDGPAASSQTREDRIRTLERHIQRIRAEDVVLLEQIKKSSLSVHETHQAMKDRGLNATKDEAVDLLRAWLDMTVTRSLSVVLVAFAQAKEDF